MSTDNKDAVKPEVADDEVVAKPGNNDEFDLDQISEGPDVLEENLKKIDQMDEKEELKNKASPERYNGGEKDKTKTNGLGVILIGVVFSIIITLIAVSVMKKEFTDVDSRLTRLKIEVNDVKGSLQLNTDQVGVLRTDLDQNTGAINSLNQNQSTLSGMVTELDKEVKAVQDGQKEQEKRVVKLEKVQAIKPAATVTKPAVVTKVQDKHAKAAASIPANKPAKAVTKTAIKPVKQVKAVDTAALTIAKKAEQIALRAEEIAKRAEMKADQAGNQAKLATTTALNADQKANLALDGAQTLKVDVKRLVKEECARRKAFDRSTICEQ